MNRTLEMPEAVYNALETAARAKGVTPVAWIEHHLEQENGARKREQPEGMHGQVGGQGETLYDRLKDLIGKFSSKEPSALSENCGEKFTDYLEQKRKEGHL